MTFAPIISAAAWIALTTTVFAQGATADLKPFPAPEADMTRQVITLPEEADENVLLVEVIPGKVLEVDCNRVIISSEATTKTVDGWGYDYLVLGPVSAPASTRMACPDGKTEKRFVPINLGSEAMRRYNSKLPLVIYAPQDVTVKYRIWRAGDDLLDAKTE